MDDINKGFLYKMEVKLGENTLSYHIIGMDFNDAITGVNIVEENVNEMTISLKKLKNLSDEPIYISKKTEDELRKQLG